MGFSAALFAALSLSLVLSAGAFAATVDGTVISSSAGQGVPYAKVEVWREDTGVWSREAFADCEFDGTWSYETTDTSPVRLRAFDPSGGHSATWNGGTSVDGATDVTPAVGGTDAEITLKFLQGAALGGWVGNDADGTPLDAIRVTAWLMDVAVPAMHVTTTADDGVFRMSNLPPGSYVVRFEDPTLRYDTQYWFMATDEWDASALDVDGPGAYWTYAELSLHETDLSLTPAAASGDSTLSPMVGGTIALETVCTDDNLDGAPRDGMPMKLYSSADNVNWAPTNIAVTNPSPGRYRASLRTTAPSITRYKFVVPPGLLRPYAESASCVVTVRGPTYWATAPSVPSGFLANPQPGEGTALSAVLLRGDGTPAPGRRVRLQASAWGKTWGDSSVAVEDLGGGTYRARFAPADQLSYRFVTVGTAAEPSVVSPTCGVAINGSHGDRWTEVGSQSGWGPFLQNNVVNYRSSLAINGLARTLETSTAPSAELFSSRDGVHWTGTGIPVTKKTFTARGYTPGGVLYTAVVQSVREFGFYSLVMAGTPDHPQRSYTYPCWAGVNPVVTSVSVKKRVSAGKKFTLTATVTPRLTSGSIVGRVAVVRAKRTSTYRTFKATVYNSGSGSVFRCTLKLPKGKYRLYPYVSEGHFPTPYFGTYVWGQSQYTARMRTVVAR
jgi:hypothetical protein